MRCKTILTVLAFLAFGVALYAIDTDEIRVKPPGGGAADDVVKISRSTTDVLKLKGRALYFTDADTGSTVDLSTGGGISDHGDATGLDDDDHSAIYFDWSRFNSRLGVTWAELAAAATTGSGLTTFIDVPADPAGNTNLGEHLTDVTLHYYRPAQIVVVSKSDTGRGGEYSTIQGAIDSITDSATNKRYVVLIYPGEYGEAVLLDENFVSLVGLDRDACVVSYAGDEPLEITATNPGVISRLSFVREESNQLPAVKDASSASRFFDCVFQTQHDVGYKATATGSTLFDLCRFVDTGTAGLQSWAVKAGGAIRYHYFDSCYFSADDTLSDYMILQDTGTGVHCHFWNCRLDPTVEMSAGEGCFRLDYTSNVWLYGFFNAPEAAIIHGSSTNGTIYYGTVVSANWGSPSSGLTTAPIVLPGARYDGDVDFRGVARLMFGGNLVIDQNRDGYFRNLYATSASITALTVASVFNPISAVNVELTTGTETQEAAMSKIDSTSSTIRIRADVNATATPSTQSRRLVFAHGGDLQTDAWAVDGQGNTTQTGQAMIGTETLIDGTGVETSGAVTAAGDITGQNIIASTNDVQAAQDVTAANDMRASGSVKAADLVATDTLQLWDDDETASASAEITESTHDYVNFRTGFDNALSGAQNAYWQFFAGPDDNNDKFWFYCVPRGSSSSYGGWYFTADSGNHYMQIPFDSNGIEFRSHETRGVTVRRGSSPGVWLNLNDAAGADVLRIRDSASQDQFSVDSAGLVTLVADSKIVQPDGASSPSLVWMISAVGEYVPYGSTSDTLWCGNPGSIRLTDSSPTSAVAYINFPIPSRKFGSTVVLDRITARIDSGSGYGRVDTIDLVECAANTTNSVVSHTDDFDSDHQWLDSDYWMEADNDGYLVRVVLEIGSGGADTAYFGGLKVEGHLE